MGNGFELSKFRTRFLFSDVEFGWDKMWILNWVGTEVESSEKPVFMGFPGDLFLSLECKWS